MNTEQLSHEFARSISNAVQAGLQGTLSDSHDQPTIDAMHAVLATKLQPGVLSVFHLVENIAFDGAAAEIAKSGSDGAQELAARVLAMKHKI